MSFGQQSNPQTQKKQEEPRKYIFYVVPTAESPQHLTENLKLGVQF